MGHELAGVRLAKTFFDLRDEAQSLNRIFDRGVFGQGPNRLDGSLLLVEFHVAILPSLGRAGPVLRRGVPTGDAQCLATRGAADAIDTHGAAP